MNEIEQLFGMEMNNISIEEEGEEEEIEGTEVDIARRSPFGLGTVNPSFLLRRHSGCDCPRRRAVEQVKFPEM